MAWNAKKISIVAGALALLTELGLNNGFFLGFVYIAASSVAAPVIVHGVVVAHDAEEARLAADRASYANSRRRGGSPDTEAGDADQAARQTDADAADSPDMPRRLGPMLVARRIFLANYESRPDRAELIVGEIDHMLRDDKKAFVSFARRGQRDPDWAELHRADLADLHDMDARLGRLRAGLSTD